jgi:hypothetical protein
LVNMITQLKNIFLGQMSVGLMVFDPMSRSQQQKHPI